MRIFRWETPTYQKAASAQICNIEGHRLYAKRKRKGAREFTGVIDGKNLLWSIDNIEDAKTALEQHYALHFPEHGNLD